MSETKAADLVERLRHFRTAEHQDAVKEIESLRAQLAAAEAEVRTCHKSIVQLNDQAQADQARLKIAMKALEEIAAIENEDFGLDWDEIERAREIATRALTAINGADK